MSAEQEAQARKDWELYRVLTHELIKFMDKQDIDEFLQLVDQRGVLVDRMKENSACEEYRATPECQALIEEVVPLDRQIMYKAQSWLNKSRRQNAAVRSYDLTAPKFGAVGNILNKKM
jgi:hypothetical protein